MELKTAILHEAQKLFFEAIEEIDEARQWGAPTYYAGAYERHSIEVLKNVAENAGEDDLAYEIGELLLEILHRR
jgi:hypothetical protein